LPTTLSITNAPDDVVFKLRQRAMKNHRSLQGELLAILEEAVGSARPMTASEVMAEVARLGVKAPAEAARIVRSARDARQRR